MLNVFEIFERQVDDAVLDEIDKVDKVGKMLGKLANLAKGGTIVGQNKNYLIFTSHRNNITHYK